MFNFIYFFFFILALSSLRQKLDELINNNVHFDHGVIPNTWIQFQKLLQKELTTGLSYISWSDYQNRSTLCGIKDDDELVSVTKLFHQIGTIALYLPEVKNYIILDPKFLANFSFKLIEKLNTTVYLMKSDFFSAVQNLIGNSATKIELLDYLYAIFNFYSIIVFLPTRGNFFTPISISQVRPTTQIAKSFAQQLNSNETCYGRVFQFQRVPIEILSRIFSSSLYNKDVQILHIWRNGFVIQYKEHIKVLLEYFDKGNYKIFTELRYNTSPSLEKIALAFWRELLENLRTQVEFFHSTIPCVEFIPCIHCIRRGVPPEDAYVFAYQDVLGYFFFSNIFYYYVYKFY